MLKIYKILLCITVFFTVTNGFAKRYVFDKKKIGGNFKLIFYAPENFNAKKVSNLAYLLVDSLNIELSNYIKTSDIEKLNANGALKNPSVYLLEVLKHSQTAYDTTEGYFDISMKPLMKLWDKAEKSGRLPKKCRLRKVKKTIGLHDVFSIQENSNLSLKKHSALDIGGIAKGYIIDKVYELLKTHKVPAFLIEAAGDIRVFGKPEGHEKWMVGVSSNTNSTINVTLNSGQAIATSGKTYRYRVIKEKKYSHIINPKTLTPVTHNITASVVSNSATEADYLASTFNIVEDQSQREIILNKHKNAELLLLNNKEVLYSSNKFPISN
ncbi:FAD:protein FMN transferase [uncultured Algibacter sp.]|uniref:FAD:protein FMN transferase n=1 Tax=uncultured Algibacter sp. TaxID=298659 RepID=UPI0026242566|nr:FAD:protein FMN transferase [uncultured Algibacter sp.]